MLFVLLQGPWKPTKKIMYFRFLIGQLVNVVGSCVLLVSLPVLLAESDTRLDFVLNCTATVFIVDLDDLKEPTEYALVEVEEEPSLEAAEEGKVAKVMPELILDGLEGKAAPNQEPPSAVASVPSAAAESYVVPSRQPPAETDDAPLPGQTKEL